MSGISIKRLYEELKELRNELTVIRYALIPRKK
jgi:hypothetical protein